MFELFDPGSLWRETAANPLSLAVLALAGTVLEPVPHRARVVDGAAVEFDWLWPSKPDDFKPDPDPDDDDDDDDDDSDHHRWTARTTTVSRYQDNALGTCLLLRTVVQADANATEFCEAANDWVTSRLSQTVLGGFSSTSDGVVFTSLVPIPLDRSTWQDGHVGFVGTCIGHHIAGLAGTIDAVGGVTGGPCDVATLVDGLISLPRFYRDCGLLSGQVDVSVETSADGGSGSVTLDRPVPRSAVAADEWPLLGAVSGSGDSSVLRTQVTVPLTGDVARGLRLVHAALVQPAGSSDADAVDLGRRTSGASADLEIEAAVAMLVDFGRLSVSADGDLEVATGGEGALIRLECDGNAPHPTWGPTPTMRGIVIGGTVPVVLEPGIGAWTTTPDGAAYTVSLPPFALACSSPERRVEMLTYALFRVIEMCESAVADS